MGDRGRIADSKNKKTEYLFKIKGLKKTNGKKKLAK